MKRFTIMLMLMLLCSPITAFAQHEEGEVDVGIDMSSTLLDASLIMLVEGVVLTVVVGGVTTAGSTSLGITIAQAHNMYNATRFVDKNAPALAQGITLGGGDVLTDFSRLAGVDVDNVKAFNKLTRKHRKALIPLLKDSSTHEECVIYLFGLAQELAS